MKTLKTWIHFYESSTQSGLAKYKQFIKGNPPTDRCMSTGHGNETLIIPFGGVDQEIELDCTHLFSNQWITVGTPDHSGWRVFDWYHSKHWHCGQFHGHWLDITPEMTELRESTLVCGYCGHRYFQGEGLSPLNLYDRLFCGACLDSPYLETKDLHLLRTLPVALHLPTRDPLSDIERRELTSLYTQAQTSRSKQNADKLRREIQLEHSKAIGKVDQERDGKLFLLDRAFPLDNVIYYSHTGKFGFGWRKPLSWEVVRVILSFISEFPAPYEIKGIDENGQARTWEGY